MQQHSRAHNLIGLAARGRRLVVGALAVEKAVKGGRAKLVIVDCESAMNTQKQYTDLCRYYKVPMALLQAPCQAAGKPGRMCLAILDQGLAEQIEKALYGDPTTGGKG